MKQNRASNVITTRVLSNSELENLMNSIGTYLVSQGFTPQVHSKSLLNYRAELPGKRGIFGNKPKSVDVVVQVTELPISFRVDEGPQVSITVGLAFGTSAPTQVYQALASLLTPYAADIEQLRGNAGQFLAGRTFNKRVPGVACDYCKHIQEITIPFSITRIEGDRGYGPGGSTTVICSNRACNKSFPVTWDNVVVEIETGTQHAQRQKTRSVPHRKTPYGQSPSRPKSGIQPKVKPAAWLGFGEGVQVQGYDIPGGLIYVGESLPGTSGYADDACLINPRLKVSPPGSRQSGEAMGYWPCYGSISADGRGRYLQWLAQGRSDPNVEMGCVFLYLYGLERRLLIDGQQGKVPAEERAQIVDEARRLRGIYRGSNSFQNYSSSFLVMEWMLYRSDEPLPNYLSEDVTIGLEPLRVVIAQYAAREEHLPASVALRWLSLCPDYYKLRTPARRCKDEFQELFNIRYMEKFGDGLIAKPGKNKLRYVYHAASPSVRMPQNIGPTNLPDSFVLTGSLKKIKEVAESCTVELEPYSRLMGKPEVERSRLAICSHLPAPLAAEMPEVKSMQGHLETTCARGPKLISVKGLYETFGERPPKSFDKKECEEVAGLLEAAGYGLAPHPQYHNMKIAPDGSVVVFPGGHGKDFQPSGEFCMVGAILRLGSLVAQADQADQDLSPAEEEVLQRLIEDDKKLNAVEKQSLSAFLYWSLRTPQTAAGLKKNLAEVSEAGKTTIGRILIAVANADGRIDRREVGQLEKLYLALGLDREQVASDIHSVAAGSEPVTVGLREPAPAYTIPSPETAPGQGFVLNIELLRKIEKETEDVIDLLAPIFISKDEAEVVIEPAAEQDEVDPLAALDAPYRELLKRLLADSSWERSSLEAVCGELGLMPDGAMEVLNEWAFENAEAPLIDYGEPIYINIELARGIMNA